MRVASMRKKVLAKKPVFKAILARDGDQTLERYYRRLGGSYKPKAVPLQRQMELKRLLIRKAVAVLGKRGGSAVSAYFKKNYFVSTAAHHDFATHPFFANYLIAAGYANIDSKLSIVPVLSCAGISLNNSSFPRGLLVHDEHSAEQRLKLISLKNHQHPVYGFAGYSRGELAEMTETANRLILPKEAKEKLLALIRSALAPATAKAQPLSEQMTRAVRAIFKSIPGLEKSDVLYLPQEEIAAELFLAHHLRRKTVIHRIVFDPAVRRSFLQRFDGITGAHDSRRRLGTHLFWGIRENKRVALTVENNRLVSADGRMVVPLTPAMVAKAVREKSLMPSMGFTLSLLSFYYGLACAGGFSQVDYLTEMRSAYLDFLGQIPGTASDIAVAKAVPTDLFAGEFVLATLDTKETPATALDIAIRSRFTEKTLRALLKKTTLRTGTDKMMPELFKIIRP